MPSSIDLSLILDAHRACRFWLFDDRWRFLDTSHSIEEASDN